MVVQLIWTKYQSMIEYTLTDQIQVNDMRRDHTYINKKYIELVELTELAAVEPIYAMLINKYESNECRMEPNNALYSTLLRISSIFLATSDGAATSSSAIDD